MATLLRLLPAGASCLTSTGVDSSIYQLRHWRRRSIHTRHRREVRVLSQSNLSEDGAPFSSSQTIKNKDGDNPLPILEFDEAQMQEDLAKMRRQEELRNQRLPRASQLQKRGEQDGSNTNAAKEILDKVLVADFFFICVALLFFLVGVVGKYAFQSTIVLDAFIKLWDPLLQPALGVLMAGALASGATSYFSSKEDGK